MIPDKEMLHSLSLFFGRSCCSYGELGEYLSGIRIYYRYLQVFGNRKAKFCFADTSRTGYYKKCLI